MFNKEYVLTKAFSNTDPGQKATDTGFRVRISLLLVQHFKCLRFAVRYNHLERALHRLQDHENRMN